MYLYGLTLQPPTAASAAIMGSFSGPRMQEIITAQGSPTDFLVVGSDSGRIAVLQFNAKNNEFDCVHLETYGKSGVRRVVAGQYLAADPRGRALMIGAVECQKFVYVLNRDASHNLTISSPLEAHKSNYLCLGMTGVDVGFENPVFATIEQNYEPADKQKVGDKLTSPPKSIAFWEMDLGLNHVIKKCSLPCPDSAHLLIPVPGGSGANEGPSGVLVCCENHVLYKRPDHPELACAFPRRLEMAPNAKLLQVSYSVHKLRDFFFFIVQSELGDLYKIELSHEVKDGKRMVTEIVVRLLDSISLGMSICVLRSGFLFVCGESGNHALYQFTGIGGSDSDPVCSSLNRAGANCTVAFQPGPLKNLQLVDQVSNYAPVTDMKLVDLSSDGCPQIVLTSGRGPRSTVRVLQHGLPVEELADNALPGVPLAVWTLKETVSSPIDKYIVVTFPETTLLLSIGESVAEVSGTQFVENVSSLHVAMLADDSYLQVHESGIRHIQGNAQRAQEWRPPSGRRITAAHSNERQICVTLSGGELLSFEVDETGRLVELARRSLGFEVATLALQPTPPGRLRADYVAIGASDNAVRLCSLRPESELRQLALLGTATAVQSVVLWQVQDPQAPSQALYLFVGLESGLLLRHTVDKITGELSDQRERFLGPSSVRLHVVSFGQGVGTGVVALCSRPWFACYSASQRRVECLPLRYSKLEFISSFSSAQCADGFVALSGSNLRIFQCSPVGGQHFSETSMPVTYTPRRVCVLPPPSQACDLLLASTLGPPTNPVPPNQVVIAVIEADPDVYDEATRLEIALALESVKVGQSPIKNADNDDMEADDDMETEDTEATTKADPASISRPPDSEVGTFRAGPGKWGSCIRILNPSKMETIVKQPLDLNEAALCASVCRFWEFDSPCLIVGTATGLVHQPRSWSSAALRVYAYNADYRMTLLHVTPVESPPLAMAAWDGRLVVSLGKVIRIYSLGRKRLLRKCEFRAIPESIVWLRVIKDRIVAGDIRYGFIVLKYKAALNALQVICEEFIPHWITCGEVLDLHTVIGGDKFGSLIVSRVPSTDPDETGPEKLVLRESSTFFVNDTQKFETVCAFHIGEIPTAIQKATLSPGGMECVVYSTILGGLGALLPLLTKQEVDLLTHLEMAMRNASPPLCGREHVAYRSAMVPSRHVIDGDLCERFLKLPHKDQEKIAGDLSKNAREIVAKLEEVRGRIL